MKTMDSSRLRRLCLAQALACVFPFAASATTPETAPGMPARFDTAVAASLPTVLSLPGHDSQRTHANARSGSDELVVRKRLASQSTYSDGTPVDLFDVEFRGHDALAVRHGASLRIVRIEDSLLHTIAFEPGKDPVETTQPLENQGPHQPIDDAPGQDPMDALSDGRKPEDLHVLAFVHDDVTLGDEAIFERFFAWWIKRMEYTVLDDRRTHVHLRRAIAGVTDPAYGFDNAMHAWKRSAQHYTDPHLVGVASARDVLNILLVQGREVKPGAAGVAYGQPASFAMASTTGGIAVPAHELGHLMGASHDHAERRFKGPFSTCDTIMYPVDPSVVCKSYSLPNVDLIRAEMNYRKPR